MNTSNGEELCSDPTDRLIHQSRTKSKRDNYCSISEALINLHKTIFPKDATLFLLTLSPLTWLASYPFGLARGASSRARKVSITSLRRAFWAAYCFS